MGRANAAGAAVKVIVTSMWGSVTVLPACAACVGAADAKWDVCKGSMLGSMLGAGRRREAAGTAETKAGDSSCFGEVGSLECRLSEGLQLSEDGLGLVSPEASSLLLQRPGKHARVLHFVTSSGVL